MLNGMSSVGRVPMFKSVIVNLSELPEEEAERIKNNVNKKPIDFPDCRDAGRFNGRLGEGYVRLMSETPPRAALNGFLNDDQVILDSNSKNETNLLGHLKTKYGEHAVELYSRPKRIITITEYENRKNAYENRRSE